MSLLLNCAVLFALFSQIESLQRQSGLPPTTDLIGCYKEVNGSRKQCTGKYCYKMYFPDEETGEAKTKKGCLHALDAQTTVGKCTSRTHENDVSEMMCVCNDRNMCNSTPSTTTFVSLITIFAVFTFKFL